MLIGFVILAILLLGLVCWLMPEKADSRVYVFAWIVVLILVCLILLVLPWE